MEVAKVRLRRPLITGRPGVIATSGFGVEQTWRRCPTVNVGQERTHALQQADHY
jgi:hypothetical protein